MPSIDDEEDICDINETVAFFAFLRKCGIIPNTVIVEKAKRSFCLQLDSSRQLSPEQMDNILLNYATFETMYGCDFILSIGPSSRICGEIIFAHEYDVVEWDGYWKTSPLLSEITIAVTDAASMNVRLETLAEAGIVTVPFRFYETGDRYVGYGDEVAQTYRYWRRNDPKGSWVLLKKGEFRSLNEIVSLIPFRS